MSRGLRVIELRVPNGVVIHGVSATVSSELCPLWVYDLPDEHLSDKF